MLFPKYALEDLSVGSGSIIRKGNIEEFFNHVSMHKDVKDRSLAELAPSYEVATAYLVHMLEARFVNLNPFMQQMFLKLHDINWICPENPFDESSEPKSVHKGSSKTNLDTIQFIVEKTSAIDLNASFDNT
jgi:hypothetical protein